MIGKDLLSIEDLSREEIQRILETAQRMHEIGLREISRAREDPLQRPLVCLEPLTKRVREASGQGRRSLDRDLLAQNGANGEFEAVPCAWDAQPRPPLHPCGEGRIPAEVVFDRSHLGTEVEQSPNALDDPQQGFGFARVDSQAHGILVGQVGGL